MFWQRDPCWERDFDRAPSTLLRADRSPGAPTWLDDLAGSLGASLEVVRAATLESWRGVLGGVKLADRGDTPLVLSAGVHHRTRTHHALQFCPDCLREGVPHFRKAWRLGFVTWCDVHRRSLHDACPSCGAAVIPHRSMTPRLTDCHRCGRSIASTGASASDAGFPEVVAAMQARLLAALQAASGEDASIRGASLLTDVRALLAVSSAVPVHVALRQSFGLGDLPTADERLRFEHTRLAIRVPWLETVAAWTADWPRSFRDGADAAGLTRRTFARTRLGSALAAEVRRLPTGQRRDRTWVPVLDEPVLRRLRRTDPAAYRAERARRILTVTGYAP